MVVRRGTSECRSKAGRTKRQITHARKADARHCLLGMMFESTSLPSLLLTTVCWCSLWERNQTPHLSATEREESPNKWCHMWHFYLLDNFVLLQASRSVKLARLKIEVPQSMHPGYCKKTSLLKALLEMPFRSNTPYRKTFVSNCYTVPL